MTEGAAIQAQKEKESKSAANVKNYLITKYDTIEKIFELVTTDHSFYTALRLAECGIGDGKNTGDKLV